MILSAAQGIMPLAPEERNASAFVLAMEEFKKAGYDGIALDMWGLGQHGQPASLENEHWVEWATEIREASERLGLKIRQAHGYPFTGSRWDDPDYPDREYTNQMNYRCLEICRIVGVEWLVMHPYNISRAPLYERPKLLQAAVDYFAPYVEFAKKQGVGIAIENMVDFGGRHRRYCAGDITELVELVETLNDPCVGVCLDTSHANIDGADPAAAVRYIGRHLKALHVSDNHGSADEHLLPYFGSIRWNEFMQALKDIGYENDLSFEVTVMNVPATLRQDWLRYTVTTGRRLLSL